MEKEAQFDRLLTVCNIMNGARVAELRRQVEELKVQLFWKDYNAGRLRESLLGINGYPFSSKCTCGNCDLTGRMDEGSLADITKQCVFVPWFESKLAECGLTYGHVLRESVGKQHESNVFPVYDVDCHLIKITSMLGDWGMFTYGSKLWKAKNVNDPELQKLLRLFALLEADGLSDVNQLSF
jgi:hypothetical protein